MPWIQDKLSRVQGDIFGVLSFGPQLPFLAVAASFGYLGTSGPIDIVEETAIRGPMLSFVCDLQALPMIIW